MQMRNAIIVQKKRHRCVEIKTFYRTINNIFRNVFVDKRIDTNNRKYDISLNCLQLYTESLHI